MARGKILAWSLAIATAIAGLPYLSLILPIGNGPAYSASARSVVVGLAFPYGWALLVPFLASFFTRRPLTTKPWLRIPSYALVGLAAALFPVLVERSVSWSIGNSSNSMRRAWTGEWFASFLIFWLIAGVFQTIEARQRIGELRIQLVQAELQNLKAQLHPHFLFNTLHTISILMRQDVEAANRVLLKLSDLLRISLDHSRADQKPLQLELDFLETYLSIEQVRLQERLRVEVQADGDARAALIPPFLLQPLVENAVRHGIAPRAAGGVVRVSARRVGEALELKVEDNGAGLAADFADRRARGCGLRNTEGRLAALCGAAGQMNIGARPEGGVSVTVSLPYRVS